MKTGKDDYNEFLGRYAGEDVTIYIATIRSTPEEDRKIVNEMMNINSSSFYSWSPFGQSCASGVRQALNIGLKESYLISPSPESLYTEIILGSTSGRVAKIKSFEIK